MDAWDEMAEGGDGEDLWWGSLGVTVPERLDTPLPWPPSSLPATSHPSEVSPASPDVPTSFCLSALGSEETFISRSTLLWQDVGVPSRSTATTPVVFPSRIQMGGEKMPSLSLTAAAPVPASQPSPLAFRAGEPSPFDWQEAARSARPPGKISKTKSRKLKKKSYIKEVRPLGIVGHAAVEAFQKVPSLPIQIYVKKDRYPALPLGGGAEAFVGTSPTLKALSPAPSVGKVATALQMLECGFRDPSHPHQPCRVLCPHVTSWQEHQYYQHGLGFRCSQCHQWLPDEHTTLYHLPVCRAGGTIAD